MPSAVGHLYFHQAHGGSTDAEQRVKRRIGGVERVPLLFSLAVLNPQTPSGSFAFGRSAHKVALNLVHRSARPVFGANAVIASTNGLNLEKALNLELPDFSRDRPDRLAPRTLPNWPRGEPPLQRVHPSLQVLSVTKSFIIIIVC